MQTNGRPYCNDESSLSAPLGDFSPREVERVLEHNAEVFVFVHKQHLYNTKLVAILLS